MGMVRPPGEWNCPCLERLPSRSRSQDAEREQEHFVNMRMHFSHDTLPQRVPFGTGKATGHLAAEADRFGAHGAVSETRFLRSSQAGTQISC